MKGNFSKTDLLKIFKEYGLISIGGLMYSFAWTSILIPAGVMGGGLNGIGLLIYYATGGTDGGIPLGVTFLVLNAVLVGVASLLISLKFGAKTIYAIGFISVAMAVMQQAVPGNVLGLADDKLLSAILGGALAGAGIELIGMDRREFLLKDALDQISGDYDFIFIDCPPSLELLTLNALCAADSILVPVQGEYFALEGLSDLMNTVRIVRRSLNPRLGLEGVLLTMFDGRTNLALQVAEEVKHYFPGKVYATVIPRNVRLSEAPSHGKPITAYDRSSRGAEAYTALAAEFLKKQPV